MFEAIVIPPVVVAVLEHATAFVMALAIVWLAALVAFMNFHHFSALPLTLLHSTLRVVLELSHDPIDREAWTRLQAVRLI